MSSSAAASAIPSTAIVRFVALLDDDASVAMSAVQAAGLSKLVADQAAATEWSPDDAEAVAGAATATATAAAGAPPQEMIIPVPIGAAEHLRMIVKYLSARLASPQREIPAPLVVPVEDACDDTDKTFLRSLTDPHRDVVTLSSIAHYLNIPTLRDLMCAQLASWMAHMTVEQMRALLGVANDFSDQLDDVHWSGPESGAKAAASA